MEKTDSVHHNTENKCLDPHKYVAGVYADIKKAHEAGDAEIKWRHGKYLYHLHDFVLDHINNDKKLFHYVINSDSDGIVKFSQTKIRPDIGDSIEISFFETFNKKQFKKKINILRILESNEVNQNIVNSISGLLSLNYKTTDKSKPDYGFIDDYYVSKELLRKHNIIEECYIVAEGMFVNNKRSVFKITHC